MASSEQGKLAFALVNFVGRSVQVQTMTGMVYEGIFHSVDLSPGKDTLGVALRKAYKKADSTPESPFSSEREVPSRDRVIHELLISGSDVAQISAIGIDLGFKPPPPEDADGFTDTGISGGHGAIKERKLQAWNAGDGAAVPLELEGNLRGQKSGQGSNGSFWSPEEMFAKNKQDHNYKSTWDENDYTTKIDKQDPAYAKKAAEADRLAREIMGGVGVSGSKNPQLLHDRHGGQVRGMNEEDLFGSVQRTPLPSRGANAWVPPNQRQGGPPSGGPPLPSSKPPGKSLPPGLGTKRPQQRIRTPEPLVDRQRAMAGSKSTSVEELKTFGSNFKLGTKDASSEKKPEGGSAEKSSSKLNPAAKAFTFNPKAKEFSFAPKASAPAPAPIQQVPQMPQMMGFAQQSAQQPQQVMVMQPQPGQFTQPQMMQSLNGAQPMVRMPNGQVIPASAAAMMQQQQMNPQQLAMMQQQRMMQMQQQRMQRFRLRWNEYWLCQLRLSLSNVTPTHPELRLTTTSKRRGNSQHRWIP